MYLIMVNNTRIELIFIAIEIPSIVNAIIKLIVYYSEKASVVSRS